MCTTGGRSRRLTRTGIDGEEEVGDDNVLKAEAVTLRATAHMFGMTQILQLDHMLYQRPRCPDGLDVRR